MVGLITRAAGPGDAAAIHELIAAAELRHHGRVLTAPDAVVADLARPTLDLERDTLLVYASGSGPAGKLAGWAWMHIGKRAHVHVHPDFTGRGLGSRLLDWSEAQALAAGSLARPSKMPTPRPTHCPKPADTRPK